MPAPGGLSAAEAERRFARAVALHQGGERMLGGMWRIREQSPLTQQALLNFYKEFEKILTDGLSRLYPKVSIGKCQEVAYSIICLAETNWVLGSVGVDNSHTHMVRRSAEYLLQSLENGPLDV